MKAGRRSSLMKLRNPSWAGRFWSHVARGGNDECWEWKSAEPDSRPSFFIAGTVYPASRVAYRLSRGKFPKKPKLVRHTCDNSICCNPRHLLSGTHQDNVEDARRRKRYCKRVVVTPSDYARCVSGQIAFSELRHTAKKVGVRQTAGLKVMTVIDWINLRLRTKELRKQTHVQKMASQRKIQGRGFATRVRRQLKGCGYVDLEERNKAAVSALQTSQTLKRKKLSRADMRRRNA